MNERIRGLARSGGTSFAMTSVFVKDGSSRDFINVSTGSFFSVRPRMRSFTTSTVFVGPRSGFTFWPGFAPGGSRLDGDDLMTCYLPAGADWYFFPTGELFHGGQSVSVHAGVRTIPVFVKAGSIIPMEKALSYAQEEAETPLEIHIFPGADAQFVLYEDDGDGYEYLSGRYNRVQLHWNDLEKTLTVGAAPLSFPAGIRGRACRAVLGEQSISFVCSGEEMTLSFLRL